MLARYFRVADAARLVKENNIIIIKNKSTAVSIQAITRIRVCISASGFEVVHSVNCFS